MEKQTVLFLYNGITLSNKKRMNCGYIQQRKWIPKTCWTKETRLRFPWWSSGRESTCQFREHRFNPWSRRSHVQWDKWARVPQVPSSLSRAYALQQWGARTPQGRVAPAHCNWRKPMNISKVPVQPSPPPPKKKKGARLNSSGTGLPGWSSC